MKAEGALVRHPAASLAAGVRFAHPSERVFASLLEVHDIRWQYEPVELPLDWDVRGAPCRGFRPDFWLPDLGCFVELTTADQRLVTKKNAKVRRARQLYPELQFVIVYQRDLLALLDHHGLVADTDATAEVVDGSPPLPAGSGGSAA